MGVTLRFHRGAWWIFIRHHNKRTSKRIGTDKTAALRIKKEMEERLARTDLHLPGLSEPGMTVKQYGELWLAGAGAGLKASTRRFYTEKLTNHIYPELG